jgi:hypothetical protein
MDQKDAPDAPPELAALDEVAQWLIAASGGRLDVVSLTLAGYHYWGSRTEYHSVRVLSVRGRLLEQAPGRLFLPREAKALAEFLVARMVPGLAFTRENFDLQEHGYALARQADLSAHERLALIARHGTLDQIRKRLAAGCHGEEDKRRVSRR